MKAKKIDYIVGIDYSITCPAVAIHSATKPFAFKTVQYHYLCATKSRVIADKQFHGSDHFPYLTDEERYDNLSEWVLKLIPENSKVFIEGYSFGSKGAAVFNLAENCGLLKHKLHKKSIDFELVVPGVAKKFATGKGNADKQMMVKAFTEGTGFDIVRHFGLGSVKNLSPVSDIVDAHFICSYGYEKELDIKKLLRVCL